MSRRPVDHVCQYTHITHQLIGDDADRLGTCIERGVCARVQPFIANIKCIGTHDSSELDTRIRSTSKTSNYDLKVIVLIDFGGF